MPSTNILRTARLPASRCINPHQQIDVKRAQKPTVFLVLASNLGLHQKRPKKPAGEAGVLALYLGSAVRSMACRREGGHGWGEVQ